MGTSSAVSSLAKEVTCSSSDGRVVSSGGAGGGNSGCTGAGGMAGVTGEGSSSLPREAGGRGGWTLQQREAQCSIQTT